MTDVPRTPFTCERQGGEAAQWSVGEDRVAGVDWGIESMRAKDGEVAYAMYLQ